MPRDDEAELFEPAPLPVAPLDDHARLACLRLIRSENVGPVAFRELINHFGGADAALAALPEIARRGGRTIRIASREVALEELERAARLGAKPLFTIEPGYPPLLARLEVPPPLVYVKGDTALLSRPSIAIVGSRAASASGMALARRLAAELGHAGLVTVSGFARGIDAAVHEASLTTGTIAVLAGGIDFIYPPENTALYEIISREGCLLSEMPPGFKPRAKDFPRRNRIISGIASGVIVVEAARRSGSLVTARKANHQGREVFAVPGHPLDPRAEGTNALIKDGATMITSAADVLETLAPILASRLGAQEPTTTFETRSRPPVPRPPPLLTNSDRDRVVAALGPAPISVDDLARATGLNARQTRAILMELDLAGRIERHGQSLVSLQTEAGEDTKND